MSSKPRKAFDGVARPQGFVDDTAKAILKAVKGAVKRSPNIRGTQFPKNQSLSPRKFDKIYGKGSAKEVAEQTTRNSRMTADQRVRMSERDANIRANINRVEGAPRIGSNSKKRRPVRGY